MATISLVRRSSSKSSSFSSSSRSSLALMLSLLSSASLMGSGFFYCFPSFSWLEIIVNAPFQWRSWSLSHMPFADEHFSKLVFIKSGSPFKIAFIALVLCSLDSPSIILSTITNFKTSMPWIFKKFLILSSHISKFPLNNGAFTNWLTSISVVEGDTSLGGLENFFLGFTICVLMINLQVVRLWVKVLALIPIVGNTERRVNQYFFSIVTFTS